jgi:hypothetical protein
VLSYPWVGATLGVVLSVVVFVLAAWAVSGHLGSKAVELARQKRGPGFGYFVVELRTKRSATGHLRVKAKVLAYSDESTDLVEVSWRERKAK